MHCAAMVNAPCRDGQCTVPRWSMHHAAMENAPCRDGKCTVAFAPVGKKSSMQPIPWAMQLFKIRRMAQIAG